MNKTAIKNFAIWARNKLITDISYRAGLMGITEDGIQNALPQSIGTTEFYDIGTSEPYAIAGDAVRQRRHLVDLICAKEKETNYKTAYKYVLEEVAYTWFNRLIAMRFMEVNDYLPSRIRVLSSDSGKMEPDLVTTPFDAELSFTRDEEQLVYQLKQENKIDELFRILFIKQCNALNEILPGLFEKTSDYTELLLSLSVIDRDGVVYHLVHDIPEEDFDVKHGGQVEIIGWLYQYYNSDLNAEVYDGSMSKDKIPKELLPAATTIYTPDWPIRYMVENSLGRLWLEGHPNDDLKAGWKYYLEESEQEPMIKEQLVQIRSEYSNLTLEDIKIIDPCMGSGHILVYGFDVLMQIYESAGYGQRDAARSILENNLYGLDIDDRAFQMAYFAIMMKARQYNRRILNGKYKPNVYSIQESNGINRSQLKYFGAGLTESEKNSAITQMTGLLDTFKDAKEYGSILTVVDQYEWDLLDRFVSNIEAIGQLSFDTVGLDATAEKLNHLIDQGRILARRYHVIITNPPYLGSSRFSNKLDSFIKRNYEDVKADLSMVMFKHALRDLCKKNGFVSFITTSSWMYLSSFERMRKYLHEIANISSLVDFGTELFEGKVGHNPIVAWVTRKSLLDYRITAIRLVDYCYALRDKKAPEFFNNRNRYVSEQGKYELIPGMPIAYWIGESILKSFSNRSIGGITEPRMGLTTGDNDYYLRMWHEVESTSIGFNYDRNSAKESGLKWFPYNKGGDYRKWYGNRTFVVNWYNDGYEMQTRMHPAGNRIWAHNFNLEYNFRKHICWNDLTSKSVSFRAFEDGFLFDSCAAVAFVPDELYLYMMGYLNTKYVKVLSKLLNPTMHFKLGDFSKLPFMVREKELVERLAQENILIEKQDWDSFEISWDFKSHPLVKERKSIQSSFQQWTDECEKRFNKVKTNEEILNESIISMHALQNALTADVDDADITIYHANREKDIKSFLSYAVGCIFGRYSIDKEGIICAGPNLDKSAFNTFMPDDDNIIPITDEEYFENDIVARLCSLLKALYGVGSLEDNLDYIANSLNGKGTSSREVIRKYFINDFFKEHCSIYSAIGSGKRPIYWLFDAGKQNGFKALIYLHRYNADTIGKLRIDYLHRMQRIYETEISCMQDVVDHSTNAREVAQATKRREKLTKQLKECREYDEKLAHLALSRIELDLDDGVKKNYRKIQTANDGKFYEVLADSKNIISKE